MEPTPPNENPGPGQPQPGSNPPGPDGPAPGPQYPAAGDPPPAQGGYPPPSQGMPGQPVPGQPVPPPGYPPAGQGGYPPASQGGQGGYPPAGQGGQPGYPPAQGGYPQGGYPPPGQGGYPPGPGYQQYPGGNQLPPPGSGGTSSLAIVGFVLSFVGATIISAVLCIIALSRIPRLNQKGKGFAIAGLVISGLWIVGAVALMAVASSEPDRDASGQVTTTQNTRPDKLRVGDCVTELKEGEVKDIKVQPCNQPNGGKVFAVFDLPAGQWPGLATVQAAAEKGCTERFTAAKKPADKPSDIFYLHPIEEGWALGDRGTTCLLAPK